MFHPPFLYQLKDRHILTNLVELCPDGVIGVNTKGLVTIFNHAAERLTGRSANDTVGRTHISDVYGSLESARAIKQAIYSDSHGGPNRLEGFEVDFPGSTGETVPIRLSAVLLMDSGRELGSVGFFHDLSARKQLEDKLRTLSITDGLTDLFNQRYFYNCLAHELARSIRYKRPLSLICFDLDNFKQCNDQLGHLEGDNVLRLVGNLLHTVTRKTDQCFRYGGDEFFILLPETDLEEARQTAEKLRQAFNARWPYVENGGTSAPPVRRVTLSIGVIQRVDEAENTALIRRADLAMYTAKNGGGDQVAALHQPAEPIP
jgi:diguanylate cyclase (GGDEF)-like protein/PAS domain S-box-containing protein